MEPVMATTEPARPRLDVAVAPTPPDVAQSREAAVRWNDLRSRVRAYFLALGLRDEDALDRAVASILALPVVQQADDDLRPSIAFRQAGAMVDGWLDRLIAAAYPGGGSAGVSRGAVLLHLRRLLGHHPEAFLRSEGLTHHTLKTLWAAETPVVPPVVLTDMHPQAIGELPQMLHASYYRRLLDRARHVGDSIVATLAGR